MNFNTDLNLNHSSWDNSKKLLEGEYKVFDRMIDLFIVACSIGVLFDKRVKSDEKNTEAHNIGRNTIITNDDVSERLEFLFQNAILTTNSEKFEEVDRLKMAFSDLFKPEKFSANTFLIEFANFGIDHLLTKISENPSKSIINMIDAIKDLAIKKDYNFEEVI
jgi:hypothetical protein